MGKLVRDHIPDIIKKNGESPHTRVLKTKEYREELLKKLHEEADEFRCAESRAAKIEELADIYEVLGALTHAYGIERSEVTKYGAKKRKKNGAFNKKIFLKKVT